MTGTCATCGRRRRLVGYSSLAAWAGEPDICFGCARRLPGGGTQAGNTTI